ncbi:MAG: polysaccharide biosynthesis/export family protein [Candidatus Korobacteraceae bacterium]
MLTLCVGAMAWAQSQDAGTPLQPSAPTAPMVTATSTAPTQVSEANAMSSDALLLDVGDLLDVRVFDTPELSNKFRVDDHGEIILPVGGAVRVQGLTAEQAQTAIAQRFRQGSILRDPHVDVFVLEYATQGVTVAGEVKAPGVYPWVAKHTVLDFISVAGGATPAASKTVTVSRKDREQVITFQLNNSPQGNGGDIEVRPGDRILVTRAGVVYVVGDVGRPGGYLIENKETVTVLQALALAQGMNKTAKYDAKLIRNSPSGRTESDLPLKRILANQVTDPKLQDGDILFVPVSGSKQWADKSVTSILQMAVGVVIYGRL